MLGQFVATLCYIYKWTHDDVLWGLTIEQAFMYFRYGVELHTGKSVEQSPDLDKFRSKYADGGR